MNKNLRNFGLGILGGLLPLGAFFAISAYNHSKVSTSDRILNESNYFRKASYTGDAISAPNFIDAAENSVQSVVHVTTKVVKTQVQQDPFFEFFYGPGSGGGREYKQYGSGSGSGVIVSKDGYIVTNNHVIADASEIEVILNDNSKYTAKVIGVDLSTDLAVIKIDANDLKPMIIGNSDDLKIGEWVLAVGNPFNLTNTVTAGIVSAKARNINIIDRSNQNIPIESFIQTDAAVNPGNSGGALVNTNGQLVGINTAIASQTGSYSGYSFAIPSNLMVKVMSDLIDFGVVQRGFLGVQISEISQELKEKENLKTTVGVYVGEVTEDGGAKKAGIKKGDIITKIGGREITSVSQLQEEIGKKRPGDKIAVTILNSSGNQETKEVVLRNSNGDTKLLDKESLTKTAALGASFEVLSAKELKEYNLPYGVKISSLSAGKLKTLGLEAGMVITKINETPVKSVEQLTNELNKKGGGVLLEITSKNGRKDYVGFGL
jgi:serine protease Do